jgi:hypothetical protein
MPVVGLLVVVAVDPTYDGAVLQPTAVYCSFWARLPWHLAARPPSARYAGCSACSGPGG